MSRSRFTLEGISRMPAAIQAQVAADFDRHPVKDLHAKDRPDRQAPDPLLERRPGPSLAQARAPEAGDPKKCFIRVVSFRRVLLDEDNLCEKYHVDALRYADLVFGDSAAQARIITTQKKVATKDEERTVIEIVVP